MICDLGDSHAQGPQKEKAPPYVPPEIPPYVPPTRQDLHWIEVQVLDLAGRPIKGLSYELELPDGSTRSGKLDDSGTLEERDIPEAGPCQLRLTDIGDQEWQYGFYEP